MCLWLQYDCSLQDSDHLSAYVDSSVISHFQFQLPASTGALVSYTNTQNGKI